VGSFGDKKVENWMSPMPFFRVERTPKSGWEMTGMMVRVIRFQFSPRENGTTG
jgi:hypothetical protein